MDPQTTDPLSSQIQSALSKKAGVGIQTTKRFKAADDVPSSLLDVQATLKSAGIEFTGSPTDQPGIRLAASPRKAQAQTNQRP